MLFQPNQKIVLIGDSITDSGRTDGILPYGNGYTNLVRSFVDARYPQLHLTFVNKGIGGNTVRDLAARWQQDVIDERPDWLSVKIGINDAGRDLPLEEYSATLRRLLNWTRKEKDTRFILLQPYLIEANKSDFERQRMDTYGAAMKALAPEFDAILIDTQAAFDEVLRSTQSSDWAQDRIHADTAGHAVIALAFLRAIGFEL